MAEHVAHFLDGMCQFNTICFMLGTFLARACGPQGGNMARTPFTLRTPFKGNLVQCVKPQFTPKICLYMLPKCWMQRPGCGQACPAARHHDSACRQKSLYLGYRRLHSARVYGQKYQRQVDGRNCNYLHGFHNLTEFDRAKQQQPVT